MKGQRIGYVRVSSIDQNPDRQLEGVSLDKKFIDKCSGKDMNRPEFQIMMNYLRDGDHLIVHSMDRLARNLDDLRKIVQSLVKRQVKVEFIKESMCFVGDDSPSSMLMLSILGAYSEFERSMIRERQREGIELAKKRGLPTGRPKCLTMQELQILKEKAVPGCNKSEICREFKISRTSLYKYLKGN